MSTKIDAIYGDCPVQAEGFIDGEPFYFRARGLGWSLSIGSDFEDKTSRGFHGRDVVLRPKWKHVEAWGDRPYAAGWMPVETARELIEKGANLFRSATS